MSEPICLSPKEAAAALSLSLRTLARLREQGDGPRFIRIRKAVRYLVSDLEAWLANGAEELEQ
jgi:predicted DNA-binding transcriptional regulator AlpA